jgi:DNA-binding MarR family transcriptional regulator
MQLLSGTTKSTRSETRCSQAVLDAVPQVMWFIRRNMRSRPTAGISVPQFRALCALQRGKSETLSDVAVNMGSCLPTTSRLITGLVRKGLVKREEIAGDRRRQRLVLTAAGREGLEASLVETRRALEVELAKLADADRERIAESMLLLGDLFCSQSLERRE